MAIEELKNDIRIFEEKIDFLNKIMVKVENTNSGFEILFDIDTHPKFSTLNDLELEQEDTSFVNLILSEA